MMLEATIEFVIFLTGYITEIIPFGQTVLVSSGQVTQQVGEERFNKSIFIPRIQKKEDYLELVNSDESNEIHEMVHNIGNLTILNYENNSGSKKKKGSVTTLLKISLRS